MTAEQIKKRIEELKGIIVEENKKENIRYLYLFVVYSELEQLEEELKQLGNAENEKKKKS